MLFLLESVAFPENLFIQKPCQTNHPCREYKVEDPLRLVGAPNSLNLLADSPSDKIGPDSVVVELKGKVVFPPKSELPRLLIKVSVPHYNKKLDI